MSTYRLLERTTPTGKKLYQLKCKFLFFFWADCYIERTTDPAGYFPSKGEAMDFMDYVSQDKGKVIKEI